MSRVPSRKYRKSRVVRSRRDFDSLLVRWSFERVVGAAIDASSRLRRDVATFSSLLHLTQCHGHRPGAIGRWRQSICRGLGLDELSFGVIRRPDKSGVPPNRSATSPRVLFVLPQLQRGERRGELSGPNLRDAALGARSHHRQGAKRERHRRHGAIDGRAVHYAHVRLHGTNRSRVYQGDRSRRLIVPEFNPSSEHE